MENTIEVEQGYRIKLPEDFIKFWSVKIGDRVVIYKGKETVMLLPPNVTKPTRRNQVRGTISVAEILLKKIEDAQKMMTLDDLMLPNRMRSTIRGRLSELWRSGKIKKSVRMGVTYFGKKA